MHYFWFLRVVPHLEGRGGHFKESVGESLEFEGCFGDIVGDSSEKGACRATVEVHWCENEKSSDGCIGD